MNLKMTVERSKRRSYFLSLVFITKCFAKNLLLRKIICIVVNTSSEFFIVNMAVFSTLKESQELQHQTTLTYFFKQALLKKKKRP